MIADTGQVREIAWREVFPWLRIFTALRLSLQPAKLLLATVGVVLTSGGWHFFAWLFAGSNDPQVKVLVNQTSLWPWEAAAGLWPLPEQWSQWTWDSAWLEVYWRLVAPFAVWFRADASPEALALGALQGLWALLVWSIFGAAICRLAAVQLAQGRRYQLGQAMRHALGKWPSYLAAPLFPLLFLFVLGIPALLLGLLSWFNIGYLIAGVLWPVALVLGLLSTLLVLGVALGWPLMWGAISTECSDTFDALSRSYSYVSQRPLHLLFYAAVATVAFAFGYVFVSLVGHLTLHTTAWQASWSAPHQREQEIHQVQRQGLHRLTALPREVSQNGVLEEVHRPWGDYVIALWATVVQTVVASFPYAFFWTVAVAIYQVLRWDAEATHLDEVHLDEEEEEQAPVPVPSAPQGVAPSGNGSEAGSPASQNAASAGSQGQEQSSTTSPPEGDSPQAGSSGEEGESEQ